MKEEISYLGILGSSTKENIPGTRLNDIDILLIVKNKLTAKFIKELKLFIKNEIRKKNNISGSNILLIPEYRDAPLRPAPQGDKTVYQLHILLHEEWQTQEWPAFIRKSRLLLHRNIKGKIENHVEVDENLFKEMTDNVNWSFSKMKEYCIKEFIPCRKWDISTKDESVTDNCYSKYFRENWETLEFLGYCCTKSFVNILIARNNNEAIYYSEDDIIDAVSEFLDYNIVKKAESVMHAKMHFRKTGVYDISTNQLSEYRNHVISVLDYLDNWVSKNYLT